MTRPGDPIQLGDDVGGGHEPGRWGKLIRFGQDEGGEFYIIKKYKDDDPDGEPSGQKIRSRFIWPTHYV